MSRRGWLVLLVCAAWPLNDARALASRPEQVLQEAVALALDAEFEAALAIFDELLASGELDREGRVRLLSERALVLFALGAEEELDRNLRELARLSPQAHLSERAPPALLARWQSVAAAARAAHHAREAAAVPATARVVLQPLPQETDSGLSPRAKRALWIAGAAATATAVLVTALVLTLPSDPGARTAVHPSVEF